MRLQVFAHYFGLQSDAADAFNAAFRIPNFLQNLFGEGALSASFIPVYASLVARGERRDADRVAGAVAALLALVVSVLVVAGVLAAPVLIGVIAPGFQGGKRDLTIVLVRILFPGAGLLTLSAWCLGVLNSHRRFLLSYAAPVLWNAAMIATLVRYGATADLPRLAVLLAWGSVVGSLLQFVVQVPVVLRLAPDLRFAFDTASAHVRTIARNFVPAFFSRGVVQVSAYIDALIASFLPTGAVTGLANAQLLYTLPVSLFGMSVAAAELPLMAGEADEAGGETGATRAGGAAPGPTSRQALRGRLDAGLRRIAFFVVPSAVAFLALGDVLVSALLESGRFRRADAEYVWAILAGASVGLLASTLGRLYASAYYALRDTRTPLRFAMVRVALTTVLGYLFAIPVPRALGIPLEWGAAGLTASAGVAGWVEFLLLRRTLNQRIGPTGIPRVLLVKLWGLAAAAAAVAFGLKLALPPWHPLVVAAFVLGTYGVIYLGVAVVTGLTDVQALAKRLRRR